MDSCIPVIRFRPIREKRAKRAEETKGYLEILEHDHGWVDLGRLGVQSMVEMIVEVSGWVARPVQTS